MGLEKLTEFKVKKNVIAIFIASLIIIPTFCFAQDAVSDENAELPNEQLKETGQKEYSELPLEYILSDDCIAQGGKITDVISVSSETPKGGTGNCPEGEISLGIVEDVNCVCKCCKKEEPKKE